MVVDAVESVKVMSAFAFHELIVNLDGPGVGLDHLGVVASERKDMCWHMN